MAAQLRIQGASIVLRGSFSPAMFHPAWFAANNLIRSQEADAARVEIVHSKVAAFTAEWLQLTVTEDRFQAGTAQESSYDPLRDLVLGVLSLLSSIPLRQLGLNCDFHYEFLTAEAWHAVGHRLAPKQPWEPLLQEPGMLNLTMQGKRSDGRNGHNQVMVGPSAKFPTGIYINVNDHYELESGTDGLRGVNDAAQVLAERWRQSLAKGREIADALVTE